MTLNRWYRFTASLLLIGLNGCTQALLIPEIQTSEFPVAGFSSTAPGTLTKEKSAEACMRTAAQLDSENHFREAIQLYERARSFDPKIQHIARRLAVLHAKTENAAQATVEFKAAIDENPKDADLRADYGYFLMKKGELDAAEEQLQAALKATPKHPRAVTHLAMLRGEQHRYDESFELFRQSVGPAAAHSNVGVILAKHGNREEAATRFRQAKSLAPELSAPDAFLAYFEKTDE